MGGFPPVGGPYRAVLSYLTEIIQPENLRSLRATFDLPVTEADYQQFITYYQCLQDFNERMELARLRCRRLCVIGDADRITTPSGADIDLVGPVLDNRDELADLGWDVRMVKDADHEQAMAPDVFPEVVSLWLDANQPARPGS
jgi:hypothetical protein